MAYSFRKLLLNIKAFQCLVFDQYKHDQYEYQKSIHEKNKITQQICTLSQACEDYKHGYYAMPFSKENLNRENTGDR